MARTSEEWSTLLGSTLSKMALVRGTDSPDAYLPDECYRVIATVMAVATAEARAEGYAAARETRRESGRAQGSLRGVIRQIARAVPLARRLSWSRSL